jgi:hypothetical protein
MLKSNLIITNLAIYSNKNYLTINFALSNVIYHTNISINNMNTHKQTQQQEAPSLS